MRLGLRGLGDDPSAVLYYERRRDWRARLEVGNDVESVVTDLRGARVRRGGPHPRSTYRSDPSPAEIAELLQASYRTGNKEDHKTTAGLSGSFDEDREIELLRELVSAVEKSARVGAVRAIARGVAFRQHVLVGTAEAGLREDSRWGGRLRLEVHLASGRRRPCLAVGEMVIPPRAEQTAVRLRSVAESVLERVSARATSRRVQAGETAAVFAPGTGGILLHELVGHALEGDTVARGASLLWEQREAVAGSWLTVVDDPRRGRGAWRIDDEGTDSRATLLVERGRVAGCLTDRASGRALGLRPTGHARRSSFREESLPRMGCIFLKPGDADPDEILRSTPSGVYVRRMESASTDTRSGRAVFRVSDADAIENGRLRAPLDPFLLSLDTIEALGSLDAVAHDLAFDTTVGSCVRDGQPLATSVGAPTCRIRVTRVLL